MKAGVTDWVRSVVAAKPGRLDSSNERKRANAQTGSGCLTGRLIGKRCTWQLMDSAENAGGQLFIRDSDFRP